jgi:uncharacterized protein YhaN
MDFSDGANIICEKNGWGKSTFVAFIRAMFYGLEGERKRSIEENERKRYKPWQGGVFGGQLVFEIQGKKYLISRVFKDKESNDEFELRDVTTNLPSKEYTNRIGEEIFKINRESFIRTVFIGQNQCETSSTDDINAKIGQLADNSNDLNNFEAATAKLAEIISKLNPNRATGSISKRGEDIAKYERIVQGGKGISDNIERYQKNLHDEEVLYECLKEQMKEAGETQKKISDQQSMVAKRSEWERLKKAVDKKIGDKETYGQKFPGKIPALEEVKKKISECNDMGRTYDRMAMYHVTQEEKDNLDSLTNTFAQHTPLEADFEEMFSKAKKLSDLSQKYTSEQISYAEKERLDELEPCFANELESVTSVVGKWNNRNTKKAALPSKQAALMALKASIESQRPQQSKKISILFIIGIILAVTGLLIAVATSPIAGIIMVAVGVGVAVVGILANKKVEPAQSGISPEFENLRRTIDEDEEFITKTDEEVEDYLLAHGKNFNEDTVSFVLQEITEESVEYASLKRKYEKSLDHTKQIDIENLRQVLMIFLSKYGIVSNDSKFVEDLYILKDKVEKYNILRDKQENLEKAEKEYETLRERLASFLNEYSYEVSNNISIQLSDIQDCVVNYENSIKALKDVEEELEQFEIANTISALNEIKIDESLPTLENLNQIIQQLTDEREKVHNNIGNYNKTLENLQEEYDEWEENCAKLKELKSIQSMEEKKYKCVSKAKKKLEMAKEVMTAKYADPILQGFSRYYEMISGDEAIHFHIDANTTVTVDELGKQRDTNTLSSGYRDLIGICLRISLVDAMYQEEEPPLIMDDPFTNLDDKKVNAGMDFVGKLAEKYQIIYFTCSASRG